LIDPGQLFVLQAALTLRQSPIHVPFDKHVHVIIRGHPDRDLRCPIKLRSFNSRILRTWKAAPVLTSP
jgi:hypothetical protein